MKKLRLSLITVLTLVGFILPLGSSFVAHAAAAASVTSPFHYLFRIAGIVEETGAMDGSSSPYWWVNSGGRLMLENGVGKTIQGTLPLTSPWRTIYAVANPVDTDNGTHPQNIFRLLTRSTWQNVTEEVSFKINAVNLSTSPNRDASNGVLLFNRYQDSANLYYAGVRVDGKAVIKKKKNGTYYTMASKTVFPSAAAYNRSTNPNLIPVGQWMGLKTETVNGANGSVTIRLFLDRNHTGNWEKVLEVTDNGAQYGGTAFTSAAYGGIRTDFMDVEFDDYKMTNI